MSVVPRYSFHPDVSDTGLVVPLLGRLGEEGGGERVITQARLHRCQTDGVNRVFVEHPTFTIHRSTREPHRNPSSIIYPYAPMGSGAELEVGCSILCQAAIHAPSLIWKDPLEPPEGSVRNEINGTSWEQSGRNGVVFVCNDWPCGLLPLWLNYYRSTNSTRDLMEWDIPDHRETTQLLSTLLADHKELKDSFPVRQKALSHALAAVPEASLPREPPSLGVMSGNGHADSAFRRPSISAETWSRVLSQSISVFLIHSMAFTGPLIKASLHDLNLETELSPWLPGSGDGSWLEVGLSESDSVVTVSPGYALELQSQFRNSPSSLLQQLEVTGIMNGIDTEIWSPSKDTFLSPTLHYSHADVSQGKAKAKAHLQHKLGVEMESDLPLFGFIGRLEHQKGVDILLDAVLRFYREAEEDASAQVVMLGCGDPTLERHLHALQFWFPGRAIGITRFDDILAHEILAGSDFLLMPSRFEPCGLVALSALRYGTIPIASAVGGLKEVVEVDRCGLPPLGLRVDSPGQSLHQNACALHRAMSQARALYGTSDFRKLQRRCMFAEVSWDHSVLQWQSHLHSLIQRASASRGTYCFESP